MNAKRLGRGTDREYAVVILAVLGLALGVIVTAAPASAKPVAVACGDTITVDTTLHADLVNCPSNGLVIGADNITLNLNGHTIDGDGALVDPCPTNCDLGVANGVGHRGIAVVGGTVKEFAFGVLAGGAEDNRLTRLKITENTFSGIVVFDSNRFRVDGVTVTRNGRFTDQSGIAAFDTTNSVFARNRIADNGDIGIYAERIDDNRIVGNLFSGNPESGVVFDGSRNVVSANHITDAQDGVALSGDDNLVGRNYIRGVPGCADCGYGISFEGGARNVFERNVITRAHWGMRVDGLASRAVDTIIRFNIVSFAEDDNIVVGQQLSGRAQNTLVQRNIAIRAGDDGIEVRSPLTTLSGNVAFGNHDLGIEAVAGVTDGGGNLAVANGNPQQCTNLSC